MRILVACEYSGIVREAFRARGHDAWSCDIVPTEQPGPHIVNDVRNVLDWDWDMMIAHPPCTYLANSGRRWFKVQPDRTRLARLAYEFVMLLANAPIDRIAIENPRGLMTNWWRRADQRIQPFMFGDGATKETHLWLKNLPPLMATYVIADPIKNWTEKNYRSASDRSRTFPGIAEAMANQWGRVA